MSTHYQPAGAAHAACGARRRTDPNPAHTTCARCATTEAHQQAYAWLTDYGITLPIAPTMV